MPWGDGATITRPCPRCGGPMHCPEDVGWECTVCPYDGSDVVAITPGGLRLSALRRCGYFFPQALDLKRLEERCLAAEARRWGRLLAFERLRQGAVNA